MGTKVFQGFKEAGVSDRLAHEAAQEVSNLERRLIRVEVMVGVNLALTIAMLVGVFSLILKNST